MTVLIAILLAQSGSHPCIADVQKLCAGVKPGEGRIVACLKQHEDQVSAACKQRMQEFREEASACEADAQRLCPGTKAGPERHRCMQQHKDQVSSACKQFFAEMMERRERREGHDDGKEQERREGHDDGEEHERGEGRQGDEGNERREAMRACRGDAEKLCKGVKPGEGRIVQCLRSHEADLSQGCAGALKTHP